MLRNLFAAIALFPAMAICAETDQAQWREEVELASGQVITVDRVATRERSGFPANNRGRRLGWRIVLPDSQMIWSSDGLMIPIALELENGTAYVAANIRSREYCKEFGDPPSSVVFFRFSEGRWARIPKDSFPKNGMANLLIEPWGRNNQEDAAGLIKSKDKHVAKPYNDGVNEPLDRVLLAYWIDACSLFKKN